MRISDWSSDVCSSDLRIARIAERMACRPARESIGKDHRAAAAAHEGIDRDQIARCQRRRMREQQHGAEVGRGAGRERVWRVVSISVAAVSVKNKRYN